MCSSVAAVAASERMWKAFQEDQAAKMEERVEDESCALFEMSHLFGDKTLESGKPVRWPGVYTARRRC